MVVIGLGITWILDGLEVTIVGLIAPVITKGGGGGLDLGTGQIGFANSMYLAGAAGGALLLGYLTDRLGRKRLFMFSLGWYLVWTLATAFSFNFESFVFFRFMTGIGIGGEYAAINSAIDELIPARRRGWTDLAINGSWWIGTAIGSAASLYLLNDNYVNPAYGWRICFGLGAVLAISVLFIRKNLPESPRYLMTHGRFDEADEVVKQIEAEVSRTKGDLPEPSGETIEIDPSREIGIVGIVKAILFTYPKRSFVGLMLMGSQAFFYNAIFFTYALVLTTFFNVSTGNVAYFIFPFAIGNVLGPICLGHFFDSVGRRPMITGTYLVSALGLLITGWMFQADMLTRHHHDHLLVDHLLLRLGRRQRRVPDGVGDLPDREPRARDRGLLLDRHPGRRVRRALAVRHPDRERRQGRGLHRLRDRVGADGGRRSQRADLGRRSCGQVAGVGGQSAVGGARQAGRGEARRRHQAGTAAPVTGPLTGEDEHRPGTVPAGAWLSDVDCRPS